MSGPEDQHTSTVEAARAHARQWWHDEHPHPPGCRCLECIRDEVDPADPR